MLTWLLPWKKDEYFVGHIPHYAETSTVQSPRQLVRWSALMRGCVKINWGIAVKIVQQKMGIGLIIWDYQGDIMACLCSSQSLLSHLIVVEYIALRRAITFCMELGFVSTQFEGDSQILINAINSEVESEAWFGHLVEEAKFFFSSIGLNGPFFCL